MITKEGILAVLQSDTYKPMSFKDLLNHMEVKSKRDRNEFKKIVDRMLSQGDVVKNKKGRYMIPPKDTYVKGTLQGHAKGFGFVIPEDAISGNDIFISANNLNGALDKDKVLVKVIKKTDKRDEGEIFQVLERGHQKIVGTYEKSRNFGFVIPDNDKLCKDIYISHGDAMGAKNGEKVVVDITTWHRDKNPEGKVIEVLGGPDTIGIEILSIIREYDFNVEFPDEVQAQANNLPDTVEKGELEGRKDLRNIPTVTIDGKDAKDLDDAITISKLGNGNYQLGVHIADVTHYVEENSPLDREAYERGTSVYLVDRVIPMLPPKLSNGICSLNAGVDRLTFSCIMEIDPQGNVASHEVTKSVIHVDERMNYEDVTAILVEKDPEMMERYKDFVSMFQEMQDLANILSVERREKRGSIDFDFPEAKIILDNQGKTVDVKLYERTISHRIIEEFMLVCNETVAEFMFWSNLPFLYRVHEDPSPEKLDALREFLTNFGYTLKKGEKVPPKELQKLVEDIKGTKEEYFLSKLILRSMQQAKYEAENLGHYGLAAKYYCHFTSPIRRYPDLLIHRIMGQMLAKDLTEKRIKKYNKHMDEYGDHTSIRERLAERAERDTDDLKKTEYMADKIGETFEGIISSVTSFGFFVELNNTVEGLVRVQDLNDYFVYDEKNHRFIGERTKVQYKLGDPVKVKVANVSIPLSQVDFAVVDKESK
ncbi:ribonuclease R [Alkalibacter rhizosphaerae]|uniref:Ribonuclease R n=1 Tax=Alkalibacter rhizosphaerae TaxID=2815577 RepID=A0A974XE87_9FIRM|nr:ribonuclease R [Alkalibacter rhizosphaerae]QSX08218.1 ribonuclease R [Alkalibacter rhizosphaerae]